jgi:hypothetical protein
MAKLVGEVGILMPEVAKVVPSTRARMREAPADRAAFVLGSSNPNLTKLTPSTRATRLAETQRLQHAWAQAGEKAGGMKGAESSAKQQSQIGRCRTGKS